MSNTNNNNKLTASNLNQLKNRLKSTEAEMKRRFGSLRECVNRLESIQSCLVHVKDVQAVLVEQAKDNRDLHNLRNRIRSLESVATSKDNNKQTSSSTDASLPTLDLSEANVEASTGDGNVNKVESVEKKKKQIDLSPKNK